MPYTMEHFKKDYIKAHLHKLDAEEGLSKFNPEERLKGLKSEEIDDYLQKIKKNKEK